MKGLKSKIISPPYNSGTRISPTFDNFSAFKIEHPVFCFKYLYTDHGLNQCNDSEKSALIDRLYKLSQMTWDEIKLSPKHGLGSEKIARSAIKCGIPKGIPPDVDSFLALRFNGKKPFVGYRNKFIFHILYIDRDFTVYNHSS